MRRNKFICWDDIKIGLINQKSRVANPRLPNSWRSGVGSMGGWVCGGEASQLSIVSQSLPTKHSFSSELIAVVWKSIIILKVLKAPPAGWQPSVLKACFGVHFIGYSVLVWWETEGARSDISCSSSRHTYTWFSANLNNLQCCPYTTLFQTPWFQLCLGLVHESCMTININFLDDARGCWGMVVNVPTAKGNKISFCDRFFKKLLGTERDHEREELMCLAALPVPWLPSISL